jgi:hypothetical protein
VFSHISVRSRSAIFLAGARYMALLHNDTIRSRSAIPLADARSMALLHNDTIRSRSAISSLKLLNGAALQCATHHS